MQDLGGTFRDSLRSPVHGWFRYSAGFSNSLVYSLLAEHRGVHRGDPRHSLVLDPFAGSGTTLVAAREMGFPSLGSEAHPLVQQIGLAKLDWEIAGPLLHDAIRRALCAFDAIPAPEDAGADYPPLLRRCFPAAVLADLTRARQATIDAAAGNARLRRFLTVGLLAVLRRVSTAGTATWQYILPKKHRRGGPPVRQALEERWRAMATDLDQMLLRQPRPAPATILLQDARHATYAPGSVSLCITSPPYLNNYDYADATRLELYFLQHAHSWADITRSVRSQLIRSTTTQIVRARYPDPTPLSDDLPPTLRATLADTVAALAQERRLHRGKKDYDIVTAEYFNDMVPIFRHLHRALAPRGVAYLVVGDSAPYGVHVPTDEFLAEIALWTGFASCERRELRARNIKWQNRKHRVPLRESLLRLVR
ncbi:MAG: site-specific DNA-methyltransferase [Chloroflexota bacterium]|nr:site-specific DNA-methyltransferase [Chloroflexota bacterium]